MAWSLGTEASGSAGFCWARPTTGRTSAATTAGMSRVIMDASSGGLLHHRFPVGVVHLEIAEVLEDGLDLFPVTHRHDLEPRGIEILLRRRPHLCGGYGHHPRGILVPVVGGEMIGP